jgi:hypothetical protein
MEIPDFSDPRDSGHRRNKVGCPRCPRSVELVRFRDHLRSQHQLTTAAVEEAYLAAVMEIRRVRRARI